MAIKRCEPCATIIQCDLQLTGVGGGGVGVLSSHVSQMNSCHVHLNGPAAQIYYIFFSVSFVFSYVHFISTSISIYETVSPLVIFFHGRAIL